MSIHRIASRYAKSLLGLSIEKGSLEEVTKDIQGFDELCKTNREFVLMLKNPLIVSGKKLSILKKIFDGKVNELTLAIFVIITKKGREDYLPEIAQAFIDQYYDHKGIIESIVTSVEPLSASLKKEITALVEKISKKEVVLTEKIDSNLIGGFVLKIGDRQIDESISSKLSALRLKFGGKHYASNL